MLAIIQRVHEASVAVDGETVSSCGRGFVILLGVAAGDTEHDADLLSDKIARLRVFEDEAGKMNLSLDQIGGEVLVISNFTLLASCRRGTRPDFTGAEEPVRAKALYEYFSEKLASYVPHVGRGVFGADMKLSLLNDGPVTIPIDSAALKAPRRGGGRAE